MSKKSSKLDLLVRVRFQNPIPAPPFPPKLLNVPTDIQRLGEPSYLNHLAASTSLPMLVDAEMGMPLDLNAYEGIWDGNDSALNPVPDPGRVLHPTDMSLLGPLNIAAAPNGSGPASAPKTTAVSWMRNTSYIARRNTARRREAAEAERAEVVDASEAAQIAAIGKSFLDVTAQPVEEVKHPDSKRKHLSVVESYDILPDDDAWSNSYIMIRFPERPSAATALNPTASASRERLSRAVLRPIMEDDQQIMEYFLPQEADLSRLEDAFTRPIDQDAADRLGALVEENPIDPRIDDVFPNALYDRIRTYEVVTQTQPTKEVLVTFQEDENEKVDDEEDMFGEDEPPRKRRKGVYFKEIHMRTLLRKTRAKGRGNEVETRTDLWDKVRVGYRQPLEDELAARVNASEQVTEPAWTSSQLRVLHNGDNAAEGLGEAINDDLVLEDGR